MVSFDTKSYSKKLLHLISWSHWFTFFNILAAIALSSYYLFSDAAPTTLFGQAYLITTWVSHIAFLTFMSFVLVLFPLTLILPHTKFIRTSGSIIFTIGLLLLVLDAFIYSRLGYHLNASSSTQIISLLQDIADDNSWFYTVSGSLIIIILGFEFIVSNYAWKHLKQLQKTVFARFVIFAIVLSFFFSHLSHIWADANLDYDILRQDTVLPLSYPATAKTLLTKYGLFNIDDYIIRKNSPLSFSQAIPNYPTLSASGLCPNESADTAPTQSTFLILTEQQISIAQLNQFVRRASATSLHLTNNIDTGLNDGAWFNLLYSLPSIYQQDILKQGVKPLLFQRIEQQGLVTSLTVISDEFSGQDNAEAEHIAVVEPRWFEALFSEKTALENVSSLLFADKLNNKAPGLHIIYFKNSHAADANKAVKNNNQYQFELFVDALLLAQKQKAEKDIIWISSIGNQSNETRLNTKPALLIYPQPAVVNHKDVTFNTSNMDLQPTLMNQWLACHVSEHNNGSDLTTLNKDRVIANTTDKGIIIFAKDKSVFVDQNGNFQSYSRQFSAPITVNADFPLMIDGVHFIKQFTLQETK